MSYNTYKEVKKKKKYGFFFGPHNAFSYWDDHLPITKEEYETYINSNNTKDAET